MYCTTCVLLAGGKNVLHVLNNYHPLQLCLVNLREQRGPHRRQYQIQAVIPSHPSPNLQKERRGRHRRRMIAVVRTHPRIRQVLQRRAALVIDNRNEHVITHQKLLMMLSCRPKKRLKSWQYPRAIAPRKRNQSCWRYVLQHVVSAVWMSVFDRTSEMSLMSSTVLHFLRSWRRKKIRPQIYAPSFLRKKRSGFVLRTANPRHSKGAGVTSAS